MYSDNISQTINPYKKTEEPKYTCIWIKSNDFPRAEASYPEFTLGVYRHSIWKA